MFTLRDDERDERMTELHAAFRKRRFAVLIEPKLPKLPKFNLTLSNIELTLPDIKLPVLPTLVFPTFDIERVTREIERDTAAISARINEVLLGQS